MITDTDRREWFHHPVTQEFIGHLAESRQVTMENWSRAAYTGDSGEVTLQANAKALGGIACLTNLLDNLMNLNRDMENEDGKAK